MRTQAGFSLIEVMVTIVIIGLLSTVVLINVLPSRDQAMIDKARIDIEVLTQSLDQFRLDNFAYPRTEDGLEALVVMPVGHPRPDRYRQDGYIRKLPLDPWGNPYRYAFPGRNGRFDVYSLGADGAPGGEGAAADIGNWRN